MSLVLTVIPVNSYCQIELPADTLKEDSLKKEALRDPSSLVMHYDIADLYRNVFHPKRKPTPVSKKSAITPMPNIAYNPSIGAQIGIKAVAGKKIGNNPNTLMSVAATSASITTKGIVYFYISHNVFTPGNKWNLQGGIIAARIVTPDFGLGIGQRALQSEKEQVLTNADRQPYVIRSQLYSFREKIYRQMMDHLFVGAGVSFSIRRKIEGIIEGESTPYGIYSERYGFDPNHYASNGLLFSAQYTTRDNQNRAYNGVYADAGIRINQSWMGSTKNAVQLTTDFRKYWSLSKRNPEHVLAFWNFGSYLISGSLPYMELPGTGKDPSARSGRGYTIAYFKGLKYFTSEIEYRFPITKNKFLGGVAFFSMQTTDDVSGVKLFEHWQPGGGAGLRVLFNKATRTNLCLDYAFGNYGRSGLFLGLNEAF